MYKHAVISVCGAYRYELIRRWRAERPDLVVVMVNPSTADAYQDDPTISRLIRFAESWRYGGLRVVNLFALRTSHPSDLVKHGDPVGRENLTYLRNAILYAKEKGRPILVAWGNWGCLQDRHVVASHIAQEHGVDLVCLGVTGDGHPKHPMARGKFRVPDDFKPIPWPVKELPEVKA